MKNRLSIVFHVYKKIKFEIEILLFLGRFVALKSTELDHIRSNKK